MEEKPKRENTHSRLRSSLSPNPSPRRARGFEISSPLLFEKRKALPPALGGRGRGMEGKTQPGDHLPLAEISPLPKPLSQKGEGL